MTTLGFLQIALFFAAITLCTRPVGTYLFRAMETAAAPGNLVVEPLKRIIGRLAGCDLRQEQTWGEYARAVLSFSFTCLVATYAMLRLQDRLPFNPQHFAGVEPALAFNTTVSFVTNTNWQAYAGETTMSFFSQMAALAWHNFTSAAVGIAVAVACARGFTRRVPPGVTAGLGNFWNDLLNVTFHVLLPLALIFAMLQAGAGSIQSLSPYLEVTTLEGGQQVIPTGPVASQEAIKQLGTNGGGFFNANAAHPFENPTPFTNFLSMFLIFLLPAGLTYTYGLMSGNTRQGWIMFAVMSILFLAGVLFTWWAETQPSPVLATFSIDQKAGNLEGKETRFGVVNSALYAVTTTAASCGAVNAMHDSFTPLGGLVPLLNIQLGEIIFGGVGSGLYGMMIFVILTVFLAGLMVGRTPEYLGKKIEAREMKYVSLYILIFPALILLPSSLSAVKSFGLDSLNNAGPHGLSEILYAFSSASGNNGSAFAGLNANTPWFNLALGFCMFLGRFWMLLPVLALAGSMVGKKALPAGPGTFPTDSTTFAALLISVILIVGALTFFPALALGPILEHVLFMKGKVF